MHAFACVWCVCLRSVSFSDDPILGDPSPSAPCVMWHGDLSMEQGLPVILVSKSGQSQKVPSYVCKLLTFLFADDESLKLLRQVGTHQQHPLISPIVWSTSS